MVMRTVEARTEKWAEIRGLVSFCNCVALLIRLVISVRADDVKSRESIYGVFKVPKFTWHPRNLASNFKRRNYANIQMDIYIGSKAVDSTLANLVIEACSRKNAVVVSGSSETIPNRNEGPKLRNLILVYDAVRSIHLESIKTAFGYRWNPRARIIVCVGKIDDNAAREILAYFWKYDLLNVALTVLSRTSKHAEIFIYNPFIPGNLPGTPGRLEKLNSGDSMFPDKLTNLHNHTIPISVFFHFPKAGLKNFTILETGADVEVLRTLSKKLNFRVDLKTAQVFGLSYTVRLPSGEKIGIIGDVLINRSDIVFDALYIEATNGRRVEFTYPMSQTGYCVLVPKAKVMPMMVRMLSPFPEEIWIGLMAVVGLLTVCFTLTGEKNKLIIMFRLLLHYTFDNIPKRNFNRIFIISCILWAYLMACIYQANFINELILPKYYKDVDTLAELYDSNLPLFVGDNMMNVLNNSEVPVLKKLAKRSVEQLVFDDCIHQIMASANVSCAADEYVTVLLSQRVAKHTNRLLLHSVKECLSLHWDVYVTKYGFPFLDKFNKIIRNLVEAGLYNKWVQDLLIVYSNFTEESRTGPLTLTHCEGVFGILILGLGISTLAFILELTAFRLSVRVSRVFHRNDVN